MGKIFCILMILSVVFAAFSGTVGILTDAAVEACADAVQLCIGLCAGYAFWLGLIETAQEAGLMEGLSRLLSPILRRLFPKVSDDAMQDICTNLAANALGMGNAATPGGLSAMRRMDRGDGIATDEMILFVIINISSVQLLPTGVMTVLSQAGASNPSRVILPSILATLVSTAVGIVCCFFFKRLEGKNT